MLEGVRDGFVGLFLFIGNWLSPGTEQALLQVQAAKCADTACVVSCGMDLAWNDQLGELVDAGIPLRFKLSMMTDAGDTVVFVRSLVFNIAYFTYTYRDSSVLNYADWVYVSKQYPQVLLALRDYTRWSFTVHASANRATAEVELLPSKVSRLNRTLDMTYVWGQRKLVRQVSLRELVREKK